MALLDTRCWGSADIDTETGDIKSIHEMEYQGSGKFRCPNCIEISLDLSEHTYNTIIAIDIQGNVSVISNDVRIQGEQISSFVSDLDDVSKFKARGGGVYKCEVYWCYSGPWGKEQEWDMTLEFLTMDKIELNTGD
ncbi:MAG: hypothetical protein WCE94_03300 [Candidatus Methanoperedens sp.]